MEPIEGVGGKRRAKTFPNICFFWVHSSTGELPAPKSTQDVRANFTHLQACQAWSLGLGVGNSAHSSNRTYLLFSRIAFHSPRQFRPQEHLEIQKYISYPMVCSGQEMVRWMQSYALRGLFGHVCLRKGWPSGGDDQYWTRSLQKELSQQTK